MSRGCKPSIFQVGKVRDDGHTVVISGWGLGLCATACACHRHPAAGNLAIDEDQAGGRLGLVSFADDCGCCDAWTADELSAILRDFQTVAGLQVQEPLAG
jgi:NADPH-dependent 2,4-dienoyl-CoA reductase/sulfur reductase-like enzyme